MGLNSKKTVTDVNLNLTEIKIGKLLTKYKYKMNTKSLGNK